MDYADLSPAEAKQAIVDDPEMIVLDVRTEPEHRMHRIDGAILVPVQELHQRIGELDPARRYVVTCEHGVRSRMACSLLVQRASGTSATWSGAWHAGSAKAYRSSAADERRRGTGRPSRPLAKACVALSRNPSSAASSTSC